MSDQTTPSSSTPNEAQTAAPSIKKEKKAKPTNLVVPPKKPKLSKAERRALQEAQRAAKAEGGQGGGKTGGGKGCGDKGGKGKESGASASSAGSIDGSVKRSRGKSPNEEKDANDGDDQERRGIGGSVGEEDKMVSLFSHLPRPKIPSEFHNQLSSISPNNQLSNNTLHPAITTLGHLYVTHSLLGGNARCRAMLQTFALLLQAYTPPPTSRDFRHDVDHSLLKPAFQYWTTQCRPHSVSMGNAFSFLKLAVANLDRELEWDAAREMLLESMEAYVAERIEYAGKAISRHAGTKIQREGDVILVFGKSEVINRLLLDAALSDEKSFRVIVADSRPLLEGRDTLDVLSRAGIPCTYVLLNALSYLMMGEVTKVFLGASALMSNGSVLSRVGAACVALLANSSHVPVLVGCETYKICNRVQLESITGNELGDAGEVARMHCARVAPSNRWKGMAERRDGREEDGKREGEVLADWKDQPNLKLLNLMYDLTPSDFVTGIVTEVGILPPSSVAVLLREMSPESAFKGTS
mmetsp:Transcript_13711/g.29789  ORF Transcript_13711/g.29789 Transcript_13711/m.29789 type:complete len:525 (+) Transcript_13711:116-1690(+)|eukprot:CAMPEP_0172525872 /NCGR_PEP_ID=MMETSP1067-20121228/889_1 /TAXON_ID=265564 ORGANISM="Thalassiosira punctigera, Strain Tpunct2005C2" /NCGR_SAMPLE_ID=MMETSP1067 /ASSEMBLY_ACC=CAM_ASM_000444 /LENGTH=524 /DNA_ID=CAMNT_0013309253 /DNA_START=114 /DNA_END=1688 /DNA_ORIENTATION=-